MFRNRPTTNPQPDAIARAIIDTQQYMTIATADVHGTPWASPVWYAHDRYSRFLWASKPGSRHSKNISARPQVGIAICDSSVAIGQGQGVYISATATEIEGSSELARAIEVFSIARLRTGRPPGPFVMSRDPPSCASMAQLSQKRSSSTRTTSASLCISSQRQVG